MTNRDSFGARFGNLVRREREKRGWSQAKLAYEAWGKGNRNFDAESRAPQVRRIEDGLFPNPQAKTIRALKDALELKQEEIDALRVGEETGHPDLVAMLMERNSAISHDLKLKEEMIIAVAKAHANSAAVNFDTALADMRAALIELARFKDAPDRTANFGPDRASILSELDDLADDGQFAEARQRVDEEISRLDAEHAAYKTILLDRAIAQSRAINDPEAAAGYVLDRLALAAGPHSFATLFAEWFTWFDNGSENISIPNLHEATDFDLKVALKLAPALISCARSADQRAEALHSIGRSHLEFGRRRGDMGHLQQAHTAFTDALALWPLEACRSGWARSMRELATVCLLVAPCTAQPLDSFGRAIAGYREALKYQGHTFDAAERSITLNNLGTGLRRIGEQLRDARLVYEAVAALQEAARLRHPKLAPEDWALTQMNLANALSSLFHVDRNFGRLEEAISAYHAASLVFQKGSLRNRVALVSMNLGVVLAKFGHYAKDVSKIDEAVAEYGRALEVWTHDRFPFDWARTKGNIADALRSRFDLTGRDGDLSAAIESQQAALRGWLEIRNEQEAQEANDTLRELFALQR